MERPIKYDEVRLVHRYEDPVTGISRDIIVRSVAPEVYEDIDTGEMRWHRKISGSEHIEVPWPEVSGSADEAQDFDHDTLRLQTEERTWMPTLLEPPMPGGVIDELRHKFSQFRDRHEPEYIAKQLDKINREEAIQRAAKEIENPLRKEEQVKRMKKKKLSKNTWLRLGQAMLKNLTLEEVHARLQKFYDANSKRSRIAGS